MTESEIKYKLQNFCPNCNAIVEIGVLFSYASEINYTDELQNEGTEVILAKCLKCQNPFLIEQDFTNIEEHSWNNDERQLYPNHDNIALKNAPEIVISPYREAQKCYRAQAYEATVIMCRKGIEAICSDKGEQKGNLLETLKKLKDNGVLENTFYKWLNELRLIGNDGAHSHDKLISKQDATDSLNFLDALITYLYHLVDQYEKLTARRSK